MEDTKTKDVSAPDWGLFYNEKKDLSQRKSIKVKLPIRQHIKLHALKLFTESNISKTVEAALDTYFDKMQADREKMGVGPIPEPNISGLELGDDVE
ncbi:MAG: hypothetical protein HY556_06140 [Euryarchaeota archaeon]|nr:hypothetical protein [Euryarchaeota archaeon]